MNTQASLSGARRRAMLIVLSGGVPLALALGLLMMRMAGFDAGSVALTFALLVVAGFATWHARRLGPRWPVAGTPRCWTPSARGPQCSTCWPRG